MTDDDLKFMRMAIDEARKSVSEGGHVRPKVGAVVVQNGKVVAAFRGELGKGEHAEYTLLERKLKDDTLVGATVYTTLEPCTTRNHPKVPCAEHIAARRVACVWIGMLDPNPEIRGKGERILRDKGIIVNRFPHELILELEELNRDFTRAQLKPSPQPDSEALGLHRTELHGNRRVLTVFIGSPGDVAKEMESAREVVDDINKVVHEIGWEIDLRGCEDLLPGRGRPQATINLDVQASHVFIGLLYTRWGTPSGEFSSAFEQMFEIARTEGVGREVWLFFKRVPNSQLQDPGDQLSKVLAFRSQIEERREVTYYQVASTAEWKRVLATLLYKHILGLNERSRPKAIVPAGTVVQSTQLVPAPSQEAKSNDPPDQLRKTLNNIGEALEAPGKVGSFQAVRLHLLSTSLLSKHIDTLLGVHEINLLYQYRGELEPADFESILILRTLVAGDHDVVAGWFWFRQDAPEETIRKLFRLAIFARDENIRIRATRLLTELKVQAEFPDLPREAVLQRLLEDGSPEARAEKLKYIATVASQADLPVLDRAKDDSDDQVRDQAAEGRLLVLSRDDPDRVLNDVIQGRHSVSDSVLAELRSRAQELSVATLLSATAHPEEAVRQFAVEELDARGELTADRALTLEQDPAENMKGLCYRALIRAGKQVDLENAAFGVNEIVRPVLVDQLKRKPLDELRAKFDWFTPDSLDAYEAAGDEYPAEMADQVRADLSDQFARFRTESVARLRNRFGVDNAAVIEKMYDKRIDGYCTFRKKPVVVDLGRAVA